MDNQTKILQIEKALSDPNLDEATRKIQAPRYYLLDADELDMVADMANDFYTSRLSEMGPRTFALFSMIAIALP